MFISSYENLRKFILEKTTITSLVQLEYNAFAPACIPVATFTLSNQNSPNFKGGYIKLSDFRGVDIQPVKALEAIKNPNCGWFYRASASDFKKIPGSAIAYWVSDRVLEIFEKGTPIGKIAFPRKGNTTTDNNRFLRFWVEVNINNCAINYLSVDEVVKNNKKWIPYNKGGGFRKWYGFNEYLINWFNKGEEIKAIPHSVIANEQFFFKPGLTWSTVTSSNFSIRNFGSGYIFDFYEFKSFYKVVFRN
jgi:hypothetical protein